MVFQSPTPPLSCSFQTLTLSKVVEVSLRLALLGYCINRVYFIIKHFLKGFAEIKMYYLWHCRFTSLVTAAIKEMRLAWHDLLLITP